MGIGITISQYKERKLKSENWKPHPLIERGTLRVLKSSIFCIMARTYKPLFLSGAIYTYIYIYLYLRVYIYLYTQSPKIIFLLVFSPKTILWYRVRLLFCRLWKLTFVLTLWQEWHATRAKLWELVCLNIRLGQKLCGLRVVTVVVIEKGGFFDGTCEIHSRSLANWAIRWFAADHVWNICRGVSRVIHQLELELQAQSLRFLGIPF